MDMEFVEDDKIVVEKDGKEKEYDVLFTFDSEDTLKTYIGYTDHSIAPNGRKNIFVSAINPFKKEVGLEKISSEAELQMVNEVLMQIDQESRNS